MNNRALLVLVVIVLLAGAVAGWFVFMNEPPQPPNDAAPTARGNNESNSTKDGDRSLTNANANSKADSRTAANSKTPGARTDAGNITVRLRVLDNHSEFIRDAFVSSTSDPAPVIQRHEHEMVIEGAAPLNITIFADGYFGTRFLEFNETPTTAVQVTLARRVTARLTVKLEGGAKTEGVTGLFVASSGDSSNYQFAGIDGLMVEVPDGDGEAGWTNGYYQSDMKKVKFTDGINLEFTAVARPVGTVKIQCKEKPTLQFWIDPSGGRVFKKDQMMGGAMPTGAEGEWIFEKVPAGPARVMYGNAGDGNTTIEEITIAAGSTLTLKH